MIVNDRGNHHLKKNYCLTFPLFLKKIIYEYQICTVYMSMKIFIHIFVAT